MLQQKMMLTSWYNILLSFVRLNQKWKKLLLESVMQSDEISSIFYVNVYVKAFIKRGI